MKLYCEALLAVGALCRILFFGMVTYYAVKEKNVVALAILSATMYIPHKEGK